jgi:hypothetical protein
MRARTRQQKTQKKKRGEVVVVDYFENYIQNPKKKLVLYRLCVVCERGVSLERSAGCIIRSVGFVIFFFQTAATSNSSSSTIFLLYYTLVVAAAA